MTHKNWKSVLRGNVVIVATLSAAGAYAQQRSFNLPEQDATQSLPEFARQAGIQIAAPSEELKGLRTPQIKGEFDVRAALEQLLQGSGLTVASDENGMIVLQKAISTQGSAATTSLHAREEWLGVRLAQQEGTKEVDDSSAREGRGERGEGSSAAKAEDESKLEEIMVTARKVSERLQDVPIAVTAISAKELQRRGAVDIKDVLNSVPGLSATGTDRGSSNYTIRGMRQLGGRERTTGIYYDDVAITAFTGGLSGDFDPILFDIERVEVLRGPQGTLFGGSAMGGAIRYVTALPDPAEFSLDMASGAASTEHGSPSYNGESILNLPLVKNVLALRVGARFVHEGGYIDNVSGLDIEDTAFSSTPFPVNTPLVRSSLSNAAMDDYNSSDTLAVRASLLWQPDASFSIRPSIFIQNGEQANPGAFFTNLPELTTSYRFTNQSTEDEARLYTLDVQKDFAGVTLSSLTAQYDRDYTWDRDYSFYVGGVIPFLYDFDSFANYPGHASVFSQELKLTSQNEADDRLRWTLGLFYSKGEDGFDGHVYVYEGPPPFDVDILQANRYSEIENRAVFADATFALTDRLDISAGVRKFEIERYDLSVDAGIVGQADYERTHVEDGVNPRLNISYELSDDHMMYVSASEGFRPGGPQSGAFTSTGADCDANLARLGFTTIPTQYESDGVWSYELGSKNQFHGGRGVFNAAVYQIDWSDIQQGVFLTDCGQGLTVNAGQARIRGAEAEMRYLFENALEFGATVSYSADAEITDPGAFSGFSAGDPIQGVPDWVASVFGEYSTAVTPDWQMRLRASYEYRGDQHQGSLSQFIMYSDGATQVIDFSAPIQEAYDLANASVAFDRDDVTVRLFVNNIFDNRPILDADYSFHSSKATTLRPRTIGVELRRSF